MTTITLAILTHRDAPRLERAVRSAQVAVDRAPEGVDVELVVCINTLDNAYEAEIRGWCEHQGLEHNVSSSDGTAAGGKNACLDVFRASGADYLCQLDGDDLLYPAWGRCVEEHLRRAPGLDVLALYPIDKIGVRAGHSFELEDGTPCGVWGTSTWGPFDGPSGPQAAHSLWTHQPWTPAQIVLQSQRAAGVGDFDLGPLYEDYLMLLRYLAAHQRGDLQVWLSMASDWSVKDAAHPMSVQRTNHFDHDLLRQRALEIVPYHRSSVRELPMMYPPMLQTCGEKEAWIREMTA